jgi:hypothetical protein
MTSKEPLTQRIFPNYAPDMTANVEFTAPASCSRKSPKHPWTPRDTTRWPSRIGLAFNSGGDTGIDQLVRKAVKEFWADQYDYPLTLLRIIQGMINDLTPGVFMDLLNEASRLNELALPKYFNPGKDLDRERTTSDVVCYMLTLVVHQRALLDLAVEAEEMRRMSGTGDAMAQRISEVIRPLAKLAKHEK